MYGVGYELLSNNRERFEDVRCLLWKLDVGVRMEKSELIFVDLGRRCIMK